jgi:hypothetical protein
MRRDEWANRGRKPDMQKKIVTSNNAFERTGGQPNPFAVMWEEESFGLIDSPHELPKCAAPQFKDWTFPTLIIEGSSWVQRYVDRRYSAGEAEAERVHHYFLLSLNDELHVLNCGEPQSRWKEPVDA